MSEPEKIEDFVRELAQDSCHCQTVLAFTRSKDTSLPCIGCRARAIITNRPPGTAKEHVERRKAFELEFNKAYFASEGNAQ